MRWHIKIQILSPARLIITLFTRSISLLCFAHARNLRQGQKTGTYLVLNIDEPLLSYVTVVSQCGKMTFTTVFNLAGVLSVYKHTQIIFCDPTGFPCSYAGIASQRNFIHFVYCICLEMKYYLQLNCIKRDLSKPMVMWLLTITYLRMKLVICLSPDLSQGGTHDKDYII